MASASQSDSLRKGNLALAVAAGGVLFALLGPVLEGLPFADDWANQVSHPSETLRRALLELLPYELYRPLQSMAVAASELLSDGTGFLHALQIVVHGILIWVCLNAMSLIGAPLFARVACAAFMTLNQLNGAALGGNDTFSLVLGTLAGTSSVVVLLESAQANRWAPRYWVSIALLVVALLGKESSLGYVALSVIVLLARFHSRLAPAMLWIAVAVPVLIGASYLLWRQSLGAAGISTESDGSFAFGGNVIQNALQLGFAALVPIRTTSVYTAAFQSARGVVVFAFLGAALVGSITVVGFNSRLTRRQLLLLCFATLCVVSTVLPLKHVSELYSYALLPFVGTGFGLGCAYFAKMRPRFPRFMGFASLVAVLTNHGIALRQNAIDMAANGDSAARLLRELAGAFVDLPAGTRVGLFEPLREVPDYSVYRMTGFRLTPLEVIVERSARPDLRIAVVAADASRSMQGPFDVSYTIDDKCRLVRMK